MKRKIFSLPARSIIMISIALLSLPLLAYLALDLRGETRPTSIGITFTNFRDKERNRKLKTAIWYPTVEQEGKEWGGNKVFHGAFAAKNAEPTVSEKAPLYILVHGTYGSWRNMPWLIEELVAQGAIVAAANHPGSTWGNISPESVLRTWEQPEDVSFLIDSLLASDFGPHIDEDNIVVIGFSLGGYTALSLAGANLELDQLPSYCASTNEEICDYLAVEFSNLDEDHIAKANRPYRDDRIRAAVALAPGFGALLSHESLTSLETPTLIIGAEHDINVPPTKHFHPLVPLLPSHSHYYDLLDATHFTFFRLCKAGAEEILEKDGEEFVCIDGGSRSREALHEEVRSLIDAFLDYDFSEEG